MKSEIRFWVALTGLLCGLLLGHSTVQAATVHVDLSAKGTNDGSSWANAFTNVRAAVAAASAGDELLIAQGRYLEGQFIRIDKALTLRGGFPSGGGPQDIEAHPTIFDGNFTHKVVEILATTHLEGLRIFNGFGGGIIAFAELTLVRCQVVGNTMGGVGLEGGGIYAEASLAIHHSRISGNLTFNTVGDSSGGGIRANTLLLNHSVVHNNRVVSTDGTAQGGGIYVVTQATLIHSRISANQAIILSSSSTARGGGVYGNTTLAGSVLWGNTEQFGEFVFSANEHEGGSLIASHSLIRSQNPTGTGNIDATVAGFDPGFLSADISQREHNFGLQADSVLIDAGDATALPSDVFDLDGDGDVSEAMPLDLLGAARVHGAGVDIGPFELNLSQKDHNSAASHYYFDQNSQAVVQDGLSWATAFSSLNDWFYLSDRSNINQLSIATGHYPTTGTLVPNQPVTIYGGLNPADGLFTIGQFSVIDPGHDTRVMRGSLLAQGMAFQHGLSDEGGGGLFINNGSITLVHSRVNDNGVITSSLGAGGGGILASRSSAVLWSSDVAGNRVLGHPQDDTNTTIALGGGILSDGNGASLTLYNSRVLNNGVVTVIDGDSQGGGVDSDNDQAINSLIANNRAVVSESSAATQGAGWSSNNLTLSNSSLWGNTATEGFSSFPSELDVFNLNANHSLIRGQNPSGMGNIDATDAGFDPGFVAADLGDYRLSATSPLLDVADATALPTDAQDLDGDGDILEPLPLDIGGLQRIAGVDLDIGPHERPTAYLVGGTITGLLPGNSLTIQNNAADDALISTAGAFSFATPMAYAQAYAVSILNQPSNPIQPCTVNNATGTILNDDITNVLITCEAGNDLIFRDGFDGLASK